MSDSLQPHELQHASLPCLSPSPGACSNSSPLSQWWHPTISSSGDPFSFCLQSFLASVSFPMSQLFAAGGQSIGASASVLINIQGWFLSGLTDLISLLSKGFSRVFSSTTLASVLHCSAFFMVQLSRPYMTIGKTIALTIWTFVGKVMSLLFNMLSRLVIAFLPRSKHLLISRLQSPIHSDSGAPEKKIYHCFHFFPIDLPRSDGTGCHELSFLNVEFQASFFTLLFHPHQEAR